MDERDDLEQAELASQGASTDLGPRPGVGWGAGAAGFGAAI
jgi:hypothetical protein